MHPRIAIGGFDDLVGHHLQGKELGLLGELYEEGLSQLDRSELTGAKSKPMELSSGAVCSVENDRTGHGQGASPSRFSNLDATIQQLAVYLRNIAMPLQPGLSQT